MRYTKRKEDRKRDRKRDRQRKRDIDTSRENLDKAQ